MISKAIEIILQNIVSIVPELKSADIKKVLRITKIYKNSFAVNMWVIANSSSVHMHTKPRTDWRETHLVTASWLFEHMVKNLSLVSDFKHVLQSSVKSAQFSFATRSISASTCNLFADAVSKYFNISACSLSMASFNL